MRLADRLARRRRTSRSAVFREGVRALAENERRERDSAARRKRQLQAVASMDRLARKAGDWPAEEILRAWRYRGGRDSS